MPDNVFDTAGSALNKTRSWKIIFFTHSFVFMTGPSLTFLYALFYLFPGTFKKIYVFYSKWSRQ